MEAHPRSTEDQNVARTDKIKTICHGGALRDDLSQRYILGVVEGEILDIDAGDQPRHVVVKRHRILRRAETVVDTHIPRIANESSDGVRLITAIILRKRSWFPSIGQLFLLR